MLSLDTNGEMWRLRCHWVSMDRQGRHIYYSKVLRCWAVEDPRDNIITEARASMRNIVDYMREVLFKNRSTIVDNYEKTFDTELLQFKSRQLSNNVRPEPADFNIQGALNHSFINETQSSGFGS